MKNNKADIPYIGRLFIRKPIGWGSASVKKLSETTEEMEKELLKKQELILEKYGNSYQDKEEYKNYEIQLNSFLQLKFANKTMKLLSDEYRKEEKKEKPDWIRIEDIKNEMVRLATEALLNTKKPEEK
jgi:predicted metal-dependent hydrolase